MTTGYTWEYIDEFITFPRYAAMKKYWHQHPPTHVLMLGIAQGLGYQLPNLLLEPEPISETEQTEQDLDELKRIFALVGGVVNG